MKLNNKKTVLMSFSKSRSLDFQPKILVDQKLLEVVESQKLLGVVISSDLKWTKHVKYIENKFMKKLWMLRRVKELGGSLEDLKTVYKLQLRCLTEDGCPAFNGALTIENDKNLERLQKVAFRVILGSSYTGYYNAMETLKKCTKFAQKTAKNPKYKAWFQKMPNRTRTSKPYYEYYNRTERYRKSPLFYLTSLLNK